MVPTVCLQFVDPRVTGLDAEGRAAFVKRFCSALEREGVALDVAVAEPNRPPVPAAIGLVGPFLPAW